MTLLSNQAHCARAVTLLDCTLRDGGYLNGHDFSAPQIDAILTRLLASGVDVIEVGYFRRRNVERHPSTVIARCPPAFLASLARTQAVRYAVMVPPGDAEPADLDELAELPVSVVRFTCTDQNLPKVLALGERAARLGLVVCANITRVSERSHSQLAALTRALAEAGFDTVYAADSNGALYPDEVAAIVGEMRRHFTGQIGFHAHDSLHLAFANALAAMRAGASWVDGTIGGVGKGGGNAAIEVLLSELAKADSRPIDIAGFSQMPASFPHDFFPVRFKERLDNVFYGRNNLNIDKIKSLESRPSH
ncbi:pyruvate carboxyltransferase [Burkholderia glumae]|uniref:Pyruvate carboxyltransferase n=1 Tax=Burkholderia glumae TaxID=337 RepID=A0AAP9XXM8_BURGL|nr:pyruvate carboxyltransferase [Burkholderia glumae]ACR31015.1 MhpE-like protein [Burkholderia glumae BGR1]AJY64021.1 HMGL-like family protein [Burkholderia glumae LMG 2196 = ATCC 33617]KHJ62155.1 pyruvate carboxyltransferase [Burkholderia glumae]MCM2483662.1 pyruvate carboxyltransferase [Burkholderia glumae]MCM2494014.1 pyruvate carboxyltransferase [Burkholderia glumae]